MLEDQRRSLRRYSVELLLLGDEVDLGLGLHLVAHLAGSQDLLLLLQESSMKRLCRELLESVLIHRTHKAEALVHLNVRDGLARVKDVAISMLVLERSLGRRELSRVRMDLILHLGHHLLLIHSLVGLGVVPDGLIRFDWTSLAHACLLNANSIIMHIKDIVLLKYVLHIFHTLTNFSPLNSLIYFGLRRNFLDISIGLASVEHCRLGSLSLICQA